MTGFTLLEVLVATAVFAIVATAGATIWHSTQLAWRKQRASMDVIQNARWALEAMVNELRLVHTISVGAVASGRGLEATLPSNLRVWYWRGEGSDDSDAGQHGASAFLYRGVGNTIDEAYQTRQQLANAIADNPSGTPLFQLAGKLLTIELTASKEAASCSLRTQMRLRN